MDRQNDLRLEAKHLVKFSENFKSTPNIIFPRPIPNYITTNALVETFEEGESINLYMKDCDDEELKHKLVKLCSVSLLEMVFKHNFVHGDLHPGIALYTVDCIAYFPCTTENSNCLIGNNVYLFLVPTLPKRKHFGANVSRPLPQASVYRLRHRDPGEARAVPPHARHLHGVVALRWVQGGHAAS